jgi:hypothetical protein
MSMATNSDHRRRLRIVVYVGLLLLVLPGLFLLYLRSSAAPVTATDCSVFKASQDRIILKATITNHTAKPMTYVGVLVEAAGINGAGASSVEYEFHAELAPFETPTIL